MYKSASSGRPILRKTTFATENYMGLKKNFSAADCDRLLRVFPALAAASVERDFCGELQWHEIASIHAGCTRVANLLRRTRVVCDCTLRRSAGAPAASRHRVAQLDVRFFLDYLFRCLYTKNKLR